jgi:hypothetical protein
MLIGHIGLAQPIASQLDPRSRQVLSGREPEQGADALIELELGEPRSRREIRNPQRGIEMVVDMPERRRQRGHSGLEAGIRRIAGDAGKSDDPAGSIEQRLLPGQRQFQTCDLGDGVPFVGCFQWTRQQRFFAQGLWRVTGVNTG